MRLAARNRNMIRFIKLYVFLRANLRFFPDNTKGLGAVCPVFYRSGPSRRVPYGLEEVERRRRQIAREVESLPKRLALIPEAQGAYS